MIRGADHPRSARNDIVYGFTADSSGLKPVRNDNHERADAARLKARPFKADVCTGEDGCAHIGGWGAHPHDDNNTVLA